MPFLRFLCAVAAVSLLTACMDSDDPVEPAAAPLAAAFAIDPVATCTGATMPISECEALTTSCR